MIFIHCVAYQTLL